MGFFNEKKIHPLKTNPCPRSVWSSLLTLPWNLDISIVVLCILKRHKGAFFFHLKISICCSWTFDYFQEMSSCSYSFSSPVLRQATITHQRPGSIVCSFISASVQLLRRLAAMLKPWVITERRESFSHRRLCRSGWIAAIFVRSQMKQKII